MSLPLADLMHNLVREHGAADVLRAYRTDMEIALERNMQEITANNETMEEADHMAVIILQHNIRTIDNMIRQFDELRALEVNES